MTITIDRPIANTIRTRRIPCAIEFAPNLRKTLQDYSPEVNLLYMTSDSEILYAYDGDVIYVIDCAEREVAVTASKKEVIVGLAFFKHDKIPSKLFGSAGDLPARYAIRKHGKRTRVRRYLTQQ